MSVRNRVRSQLSGQTALSGLTVIHLILCLAFILRVVMLGRPELGGDEGFSWAFLKLPYLEIVSSTFILHEPHPVGSYWWQRSFMLLMGRSEFAIRFAGVWLGMLAVPLTYRLCRQLKLSKTTALIAMTLMAISPFAIEHSRIARMYGMSLALTLASTCTLMALLARPNWRTVLGYAGVTTVALYVHYYAGFVVLAQCLYVASRMVVAMLQSPRQWTNLWSRYRWWLLAMLITTTLYVPWLWAARNIIQTYSGAALQPDFGRAARLVLSAFLLGDDVRTYPTLEFLAALLGGLLITLGLVRLAWRERPHRWAAWWLLLYFCLPPLITFFGSRSRGIFATRYLIPGLPAFIILLSVALTPLTQVVRTQRNRRWLTLLPSAAVLAGIVALLWVYYSGVAESTSSWRSLAAMAHQMDGNLAESQYRVALNVPDSSLEYYYDKPKQIVVIPYRYADPIAADETVNDMTNAGVRRVLLQLVGNGNDGWGGNQVAQTALRKAYTQLEERFTGRWIVQLYVRTLPEELSPINNDNIFDNRLTLSAAKIVPDVKGQFVEVHLRWRGQPETLNGSEKIYVHVRPAHGDDQVLGQLDIPFTPDLLQRPISSYGLRLAENIPAGDYRIVAGIYDPAQPGMPRLHTASGADGVTLAQFSVP